MRDELKQRDEWIRGVLGDSELSPFTRLVAIRFGLSAALDDWPKLRLGVEYAAIAADIGLPETVVGRAVAMLVNERHWLEAYQCIGSDAVHFKLGAGPSKKGIRGTSLADSYRRNKQRRRADTHKEEN